MVGGNTLTNLKISKDSHQLFTQIIAFYLG